MSGHNTHNLKTVLFAGVLMLLNSTNIQAVTPACGTTLTTNTTLDSDMICPDRPFSLTLDQTMSSSIVPVIVSVQPATA